MYTKFWNNPLKVDTLRQFFAKFNQFLSNRNYTNLAVFAINCLIVDFNFLLALFTAL